MYDLKRKYSPVCQLAWDQGFLIKPEHVKRSRNSSPSHVRIPLLPLVPTNPSPAVFSDTSACFPLGCARVNTVFVTGSLTEEYLSHGIPGIQRTIWSFRSPPSVLLGSRAQVLVVWSDRNATVSRVSELHSIRPAFAGWGSHVPLFSFAPGLVLACFLRSSSRRRVRAASPPWLKDLRLSSSRFSFFPSGFLFSWTKILSSPGLRGRRE